MKEQILYDRTRLIEQEQVKEWFDILCDVYGPQAVSEALSSLPQQVEPDPVQVANEPDPEEWRPKSLEEVLSDDWIKNYGQRE